MKLSRILALVLLGIALLGFGCGKKAPSDPDKALVAVVDAVKANKPGDLWVLLPPSYQKDVQDVATAATTKLDKELFELAVQVIDKAVVVVDKQGDKLTPPITADQRKLIKDGHAALKDSGLLDYGTVSKLDVPAFLKSGGTKLMVFGIETFKAKDAKGYEEFQKGLDSIQVKVIKTEGDKSELEVTLTGPDGKPTTDKLQMVKVEGCWLPADMATSWKAMLPMVKTQVETGLGELTKNKADVKQALTGILAMLTKAEGGDLTGLDLGPLTGMLDQIK
jgi:hypothetical protein